MTSTSKKSIVLTATIREPESGQRIELVSKPGAVFALEFDPSRAVHERNENDLVFDFESGGKVTISNFFRVGDGDLPSFLVGDDLTPAAELFNGSGLDMSPAAGPAARAQGSGVGSYSDDPGDLIGGMDRLGSLGTTRWGYEREPEVEYWSTDALDLGPQITIVPEPGPGTSGKPGMPEYMVRANDVHLVVNEGYLPNGSLVPQGETGGALVARPSFIITSENGLASITINGQVYPVFDGMLEGFPAQGIQGPGGIVSNPQVTELDNGQYRLSFDYTFSDPHTHGGEGRDHALADEPFVITVRDNDGNQSGQANLKVEIVDDIPQALDDTLGRVAEGGTGSVNVLDNDNWGADEPGAKQVTSATIDDGNGGQMTLVLGQTTDIPGFGKVTLQADGTLTFEATVIPGAAPVADRTVTYTITDADGDTSSAQVVLSRDNTDNPVIIPDRPGADGLDLGVHEHGLVEPNGTHEDGNSFTTVAEAGLATITFTVPGASGPLTLTVPAQGAGPATGSVTISHNGVDYGTFTATVDANGKTTYGFTLSEALDNSAPKPAWLSSLDGDKGTFDVTITITDTLGQTSTPAKAGVTIVDDAPTSTLTFEDTYGPDDGIVASGTTSYGKFAIAKGADHGAGDSFTVNGVSITSDNTRIDIPDYGTLIVNLDGTYSFTSLPYINRQPIDIEFKYIDSDGDETAQTLRVGIEDPNTPPDAVNDTASIRQGDIAVNGNVLNNDTDPDGDSLTVVGVGKDGSHDTPVGNDGVTITGKYGSVTIMPDGSYVYTPDPDNDAVKNLDGESLKDSFTYQVSDGNGGYDTAELEITIVDSTFKVGGNTDDSLTGGEGHNVIVGDEGGTVTIPGMNYNIAIIMDTSASMGYEAIAQAQEALKNLAKQLAEHGEDCIVNLAFIDFSRNSVVEWSGRLTNGTLEELNAAINRMISEGGTNYEAGFNAAKKWFDGLSETGEGYENQVYFITDGQPTYYYLDAADVPWTETIETKNKADLVVGAKSEWNAGPSDTTTWKTVLTYNADGTVTSSNSRMQFRFDEKGILQFRTHDGTSWQSWTSMSKPTWTQTHTTRCEIPEDYVLGEIIYYDEHGNRLPDENGAMYRISDVFATTGKAGEEASTIYMQRLENGKWVDKVDIFRGAGNGTDDQEIIKQNSLDAYQRLLDSLGGDLKVNVIGIGEGTNKDLLDPYDNTGGAQIINDASELDAALKEASAIDKKVGEDTVQGGSGNDILFGDAMNADHLLPEDVTGSNAWAATLAKGRQYRHRQSIPCGRLG